MANIEVRKVNGNLPAQAQPVAPRWDALRAMRDLLAWDPFGEITQVPQVPSGFIPSFEIKETKEGYVFKADMPGVKESDLEVTVTGNRLAVSGKREAEKEEKTDTYYSCERSYGEFRRSFTLPEGADMNSLQAKLAAGVLTISIKKTPETQPKKISVQTQPSK
jgi:HSP20 family protein